MLSSCHLDIMNTQSNNNASIANFLKAYSAINKQLVASGEKDRIKQELCTALRNSNIRAEIERAVQERIQQSGGIDRIDPNELKSNFRYPDSLPTHLINTSQEIENIMKQRVIDFTRTNANHRP